MNTKIRDPQAALICAESFQGLAEEIINGIPFVDSIPDIGKIGKDIKGGVDEMPKDIADIVTSATNLALALELYMKALLASLQGVQVPETHDLWVLYQKIPLEIREEMIEKKYKDAVQSDIEKIEIKLKSLLAESGLSTIETWRFWYYDENNLILLMPQETTILIYKTNSETANSLRYDLRSSITIAQGSGESPTPDHDMNSNQLGEVLKRSRNLFVSWRYIFEFPRPANEKYQFRKFEYRSLLLACEALKETMHDFIAVSGS